MIVYARACLTVSDILFLLYLSRFLFYFFYIFCLFEMLLISQGKKKTERYRREKKKKKTEAGSSAAVGKRRCRRSQMGWRDQEKGKWNKVRGDGEEVKGDRELTMQPITQQPCLSLYPISLCHGANQAGKKMKSAGWGVLGKEAAK